MNNLYRTSNKLFKEKRLQLSVQVERLFPVQKCMRHMRRLTRLIVLILLCIGIFWIRTIRGKNAKSNISARYRRERPQTTLDTYTTPMVLSNDNTNRSSTLHRLQRFSGLRIFVYKLPAEYNLDILNTVIVTTSGEKHSDPNLDCHTNQYRLEHTLHRRLLGQKDVVTRNPNQADYYYIPIYPACHNIINENNYNLTSKYIEKVFKYIRKFPYWDRSQGRDHIWPFMEDKGAAAYSNWLDISTSIFLVQNGQLTLPQYRHGKDIVVPPDQTGQGWKPVYMNNMNKYGPIPKRWLARYHMDRIRTLTRRDNIRRSYSRGITSYLEMAFRSHPEVYIGFPGSQPEQDITDTIFCFSPEGWYASTHRPYKAILLGCIPVIISDEVALAFESTLDYNELSLFIHPSDVSSSNTILKTISITEVRKKQLALSNMWRYFWYGKEGKALDTILETLAERRPHVTPRRIYRSL